MLRKFLPVCAYTANLVVLHISKPGAYTDFQIPSPAHSLCWVFLLLKTLLENTVLVAGERVLTRLPLHLSLRISLQGYCPDNPIVAISCNILLKT